MRWLALALTAAVCGPSAARADSAEFVPPTDLSPGWYAQIETTLGTIVARLLPNQAPQSVAHFAALAQGRIAWTDRVSGEEKREPYYDGIPIHLAESGERFEAGDPVASGRGGPFLYVPPEGRGPLNFLKPGRLGMTVGGGRTSAVGFFVTVVAAPWLNQAHPCFGEVVAGHDVVYRISTVKTYSNGRPIEPVTIDRVRIFSVGEPTPLPEPETYRPVRTELDMRPDKKPG